MRPRDWVGQYRHAHPSDGISIPERLDFPLWMVRHMNCRLQKRTHEPPTPLKVLGRATAHAPRVYFDIGECLSKNILDLVDSWLQFPILEDRRGVAGWAQHGKQGKRDNVWNTSKSRCQPETCQGRPHFPLQGICAVYRASRILSVLVWTSWPQPQRTTPCPY